LVLAGGADEGDVLEALTPASRLALRNAQLSALAMARLSEVRESQRRVVAATDAERRRIERDLHDAAQQQLIGVSFQLSIARSRAGSAGASLDHADGRVRDALGRLRELAHGVFPRVLVEDGLEAAVEDLISNSPHPVSLEARIDGEIDPEAAMAAYATVAATLRHASDGAVGRRRTDVTLEHVGHTLVVTSEITGVEAEGPDLNEVADRVAAAGGRLTISTGPDAVTISAVIPSTRTARAEAYRSTW
jgi:signal transduction histidine kinase